MRLLALGNSQFSNELHVQHLLDYDCLYLEFFTVPHTLDSWAEEYQSFPSYQLIIETLMDRRFIPSQWFETAAVSSS